MGEVGIAGTIAEAFPAEWQRAGSAVGGSGNAVEVFHIGQVDGRAEGGESNAIGIEASVCATEFTYPDTILSGRNKTSEGEIVGVGNDCTVNSVTHLTVSNLVGSAGRTHPSQQCRSGGRNCLESDRTRAGAVGDVDVVHCAGLRDIGVAGTGVLVEPEEGHALDAADGVEAGLVGGPVGVEVDGGDTVEVVHVAPRRSDIGGGGNGGQARVDQKDHHGVVAGIGGTTGAGAEGDGVAAVDGAEVNVAVGGGVDHSVERVAIVRGGVAASHIYGIVAAVGHRGAAVPVDGLVVGAGLPVGPLGGILEVVVVRQGGGNLCGAEGAAHTAVFAGVAGTADRLHIVFTLVAAGQASQREGVAGGDDSGAGAELEAAGTILDNPAGGVATLMPAAVNGGCGSIAGCQAVGTRAGGNLLKGHIVQVEVAVGTRIVGADGHIATVTGVISEGHLEDFPSGEGAAMGDGVDGDEGSSILLAGHHTHFDLRSRVARAVVEEVEDKLQLVGLVDGGVELGQSQVSHIVAAARIHIYRAAGRATVVVAAADNTI